MMLSSLMPNRLANPLRQVQLNPSPVPPKIHMQTRAKPISLALANLRQPNRSLPKHLRPRPFGHQNHVPLLPRIPPNLLKIPWLCHHKLQLMRVQHQLPQYFQIQPEPLMLCPKWTFRSRVSKLRADAHQVADHIGIHGPRRLNRYMKSCVLQTPCQLNNPRSNQRFPTSHHHIGSPMTGSFLHNGLRRHLNALRGPRSIRCIAPTAPQIAPARPNKNRRHPQQRTLPLQRIEDLSDLQCQPPQSPSPEANRNRILRMAPRPPKGHSSYASARNPTPALTPASQFLPWSTA